MCRRAGVTGPSLDQTSSGPRTLFSLYLVGNLPCLQKLAILSPSLALGHALTIPSLPCRSCSPPGSPLSSPIRAFAASWRNSRGLPGSGACTPRSLRPGTSLRRRLHTPGARVFSRRHWAGAATGPGILFRLALPPRTDAGDLSQRGMAGLPRTPSPRRN